MQHSRFGWRETVVLCEAIVCVFHLFVNDECFSSLSLLATARPHDHTAGKHYSIPPNRFIYSREFPSLNTFEVTFIWIYRTFFSFWIAFVLFVLMALCVRWSFQYSAPIELSQCYLPPNKRCQQFFSPSSLRTISLWSFSCRHLDTER